MKVVLIGGVNSSAITLDKLREHKLDIVRVFGFEPINTELVSGYRNLGSICSSNNISYTPFKKINDHVDEIAALDFDILMVVGLSQLVSQCIMDAPKVGAIGFHPTALPKGRGRAPIAWLVEEQTDGAATFFVLEEEADAGAVFAQEVFSVEQSDTAQTVEMKLLEAMKKALDTLLPQLKNGEWTPIPQDDSQATEYGIRKPEDGLISWQSKAHQIDRLVKAAAKPHPGAFTFFERCKVPVLSSRLEKSVKIKGVTGRILKKHAGELLIQAGQGLIWIVTKDSIYNQLRVGHMLGYQTELEIYELKKELEELKKAFLEEK
ncbi:methionyl-tRNA formyltransferase [Pseudoalteromonas sp. DY56-GL79]|uniref:methionyl-tRNA formyltransferase n=1 Tax=Pseudoalteromonas sp. DY56-GL79 TaxID=2967131 RepID=UPI00352B68A2